MLSGTTIIYFVQYIVRMVQWDANVRSDAANTFLRWTCKMQTSLWFMSNIKKLELGGSCVFIRKELSRSPTLLTSSLLCCFYLSYLFPSIQSVVFIYTLRSLFNLKNLCYVFPLLNILAINLKILECVLGTNWKIIFSEIFIEAQNQNNEFWKFKVESELFFGKTKNFKFNRCLEYLSFGNMIVLGKFGWKNYGYVRIAYMHWPLTFDNLG